MRKTQYYAPAVTCPARMNLSLKEMLISGNSKLTTMKRFSSIMMLVATVAAVSCNKSAQTYELSTFKAKCPAVEDEAKTYLKDGKDVIWAAGDAINVLTASNNEKYTLTEGSSSTEGTFSGSPVTGEAYAVYPYKKDATFANGVITTMVDTTQNAKDKGFGNGFNLAVAKEDNGTFAFKNVCGLIKFQIKGDNIAKVIITGNNNEDLAGKVNISFNDQGEPVYEVVEGKKAITIKTYNDAVMTPGTYYAVVLPQTFTKGITITCEPFKFKVAAPIKQINTPVNTLVKKGESALELSRASIKPVGYVDTGLAWANGKTGAPVRLAALRGNDQNHGLYIDFSTGRCFYALGAYPYSENCDLLVAMADGKSGVAPMSIKAGAKLTNATNLDKFGTSTVSDQIGNAAWKTKNDFTFCYVGGSELSDADYDAITTVKQIKKIYDDHSSAAVNTYYDASTPANSDCITNANRGRMTQPGDTDTHKYLVVKTNAPKEGTGYAILKFVGLNGAPWYIELFYKFGLE